MRKRLFLVMAVLLAVGLGEPRELSAQTEPTPGNVYTVQADDSLYRLADKYYQDALAWPAIWLATNQQASASKKTKVIDSPSVLLPGQQLILPAPAQVASLLAAYRAAGRDVPAYAPAQPLSAHWLADFSAYVADAREHFGIPGVALAIVHNNQIALAQGFGVRQLGRPDPVTPETIFGVGSTTKAMNAMLVASLVDDGYLRWDQPVRAIWPNFALSDPAITPQIRVQELLNMSSGVRRADLLWSGVGLTAEQVMESLVEIPVIARPGEQFRYSNQMVATGGYVAAMAAGGQYGQLGQSYARLLQDRIFEPTGMDSASLSAAAAQSAPNHATPHDFTLDGAVLPTHYHADPGIAPAGAVNASALDMARFLLTTLNRGVAPDGTRVVSEENLTRTWQPQIEVYQDTHYGMGWFIETYQDVDMVWHDGDVLGFKSLLLFIPEANAGLVLLTNRTISYGFSNSIRYRFVEALYGLDVEAGEFFKKQWDTFIENLPNIREPLEATPPAGDIAPYLGQYSTGWRVERRDDGTLWAIRGQYQWQLLAGEPGQFMVNNGFGITIPIKFETDETGVMTMQFELSTGEKGVYRRLEP